MKKEDGPPAAHPKLFTTVTCKDDWNSFPEIAVKIPKCIIFITANISDDERDEFERLQDGSMLRENRITAEYVMKAEGGFMRHGGDKCGWSKSYTAPVTEDTMSRSSSTSSSDSTSDIEKPLL